MPKLVSILILALGWTALSHADKPRVFVFTDINIDAGDPDDRQSLVHLFWYADELDIEGIVPDRWHAQGAEACELALRAYAVDYKAFAFDDKGYPTPSQLQQTIATDLDDAMAGFHKAATSDSDKPLYVLVWGNMRNAAKGLQSLDAETLANIRLITIGTGLLREPDLPHLPPNWEYKGPCLQPNWNGAGRDAIYLDDRFQTLWWLEMNWTYSGMFKGPEPKEMFTQLSAYGQLGQHLVEATKNQPWAQYFRVGDTPSVLYLIDPGNNLDDPTLGSWAGAFAQPFSLERPNYYTDQSGDIEWNYFDPCQTWDHSEAVAAFAESTLLERRASMYQALLEKLEHSYAKPR